MRILLAVHNAYTDQTSGAALTMRSLMRSMGQERYQERVTRKRYREYVESVGTSGNLLDRGAWTFSIEARAS